jgi:Spy/CpxP family protein refolding chaperone
MYRRRIFSLISAIGVITLLSVAALAQNPNRERGQNRAGQGRAGAQRVSVAAIPPAALNDALKLTPQQLESITKIHNKLVEETRALRPQAGGQPDREAMRETMQKLRDLNQKASQEIQGLLTEEQKAKLPEVLREMGQLRSMGVPLEALAELKLTAEQKTKLLALGAEYQKKLQALSPQERQTARREMMQEARAKMAEILTAEQKAVAQKYQQRNRRQRPNP